MCPDKVIWDGDRHSAGKGLPKVENKRVREVQAKGEWQLRALLTLPMEMEMNSSTWGRLEG